MKVTICGSIAFYEKMEEVKKQLEELGHEVKIPPNRMVKENGDEIPVMEVYKQRKATKTEEGWLWDRKEEAIRWHFEKIEWSEVILVLNYDKNDIMNYIGGNTFLEMGVAFHLKRNIYLLNPIPEIGYKEEILGMKPIILNNNLEKI